MRIHSKQTDNESISTSTSMDKAVTADARSEGTAFDDQRPQALAQRKYNATVNAGPRMNQQRSAAGALQRKIDHGLVAQNRSELPDKLKAGIESLSGMNMDGVKVHYNSSQPARLNAHAYAEGRDIHVAPGQERHLPHEAWHIVQQAQGRVRPTLQLQGMTNVNDDARLEAEADAMGAKAAQLPLQFVHDAGIERATREGERVNSLDAASAAFYRSSHSVQLALMNKGSGQHQKVSNSAAGLAKKVLETITSNDTRLMQADIENLTISIKNREAEQSGFEAGSGDYKSHAHRIVVEKRQLFLLQEAKKKLIASRTAAHPSQQAAGAASAAASSSVPAAASRSAESTNRFASLEIDD